MEPAAADGTRRPYRPEGGTVARDRPQVEALLGRGPDRPDHGADMRRAAKCASSVSYSQAAAVPKTMMTANPVAMSTRAGMHRP